MKQVFEKAKQNPLFQGIGVSDFEAMLACMEARLQKYKKDAIIQLSGNPVESVGLVLSGTVQVLREDADGKQNLLTELREGDMFGEVFACAGITHSPVTVMAEETSEVLHINYRKIITTCSSACTFHHKLVENMLTLLAQKNLMLNRKIEILSKRTTRERLFLYFDLYRQGAKRFTIPLSREELAAYLCVDRSAMSTELSKMQREGLLRYDRNTFQLTED